MTNPAQRGIRSAQMGMLINTVLAVTKLVAGIVGNTYALVADAIESIADVASSLIVWVGLQVAVREPDEEYPFGYGKADSLAAAIVALMLLGAAVGIAIQAIREIRTPHHTPAPWTLVVLVGVMAVKWVLSRRVQAVGAEIGSTAVKADAWHHLSDVVTSAAAFIGISIAVIGTRYAGGSGWESADDWAAIAASVVIAFNGVVMLRPAVQDLMDRMPGAETVEAVRRAAEAVPGVLATEKLAARKTGLVYSVTLHVQADEQISLHDAHVLSGKVKGAIRRAVPQVDSVLVHMEPYDEGAIARPGARPVMESSELAGILAFLRSAERLKTVTRSAYTSEGHPESVAEHTWRLSLMALLFRDNFPDADFARLVKICIIHDLGEAIGGDIPAPQQVGGAGKAAQEREDLLQLLHPLPGPLRAEITALWDEYEEASSPEAKLAKALDKLETILQHNQGQNPSSFDYRFNLHYGRRYTSEPPLIATIRMILDQDTERRAREAEGDS